MFCPSRGGLALAGGHRSEPTFPFLHVHLLKFRVRLRDVDYCFYETDDIDDRQNNKSNSDERQKDTNDRGGQQRKAWRLLTEVEFVDAKWAKKECQQCGN